MRRYAVIILLMVLSAVVGSVATFWMNAATYQCDVTEVNPIDRLALDTTMKTRGRYLVDNAALSACLELKEQTSERAQQLYPLINGAYIKARSYAMINKVFFWFSILLAVCVVGFPIVRSLVPESSRWKVLVSADQLPAMTLLAGLSFALYSDYKQKQTSTEDLMAYAFYSPDTVQVSEIAETVRRGLLEIDQGHNFSQLLNNQ